MSFKRILLAAAAASVLVVGFVPTAQAAKVDVGVCIERHQQPGPEGRLRDLVEKPQVDRLHGWIKKHPTLAKKAAAAAAAGSTVTIETWVHVIRADLTVAGGNIPRRWINDQITVLNDSYSGATGGADTGFQFELAGVTRTTSPDWFHMHSQGQDRKMKEALKVGGLDTLNIYTVDHRTLLGYAWLAQDAEKVGDLDGVVVHYQSLPGGNFEIYSEGDTATHEVGHWLDLFHTFDGGCNRGTRSPTRRRRPRPRSSARWAATRARASRARPDHELHGLHAGQLHVRVHRWPGGADAAGVGGVPGSVGRPDAKEPRRSTEAPG